MDKYRNLLDSMNALLVIVWLMLFIINGLAIVSFVMLIKLALGGFALAIAIVYGLKSINGLDKTDPLFSFLWIVISFIYFVRVIWPPTP